MKLIKINISVLVLLISLTCFLQNALSQCGSGGILIQRQSQIDSFSINFPACHRIMGSVIIENTDITDLEGFNVIDTIDQYFNLSSNNQLLNLEGLRNIQFIQDIFINNDTLLTSLYGLGNLVHASNSFSLVGIPKISNLKGLERLKFTRQFYIGNCKNLENLTGIDSLFGMQSFRLLNNENLDTLLGLNPSLTYDLNPLDISDCPKLRSLVPFPNLKSIWQFNISNNEQLINLNGIDSVERITYMTISDNKHLENISALRKMIDVLHFVRIIKNDVLSDIGSLKNVNLEHIDSLVLIDNPLLSYCQHPNICEYLNNPNNEARIYGNAFQCESRTTITSLCQLLPFRLLDFTGFLNKNKVELDWTTINEAKIKSIALEYQSQQGAWIVIDSMSLPYQKLAGKNYYRFIHDAPQQGDNNYQLRFEDLAGNTKYSQVLTINVNNTGTVNYIYKQNAFSYWLEAPIEISSYVLLDQMGRLVKNENVQSTFVEVQWGDINSGLYFLRLELKNGRHISIKLLL